jgi:hypothetical protein
MGTIWCTAEAMTMAEFTEAAAAADWKPDTVTVDGQTFDVYTDGENYIHEIGESVVEDGTTHVCFSQYGLNKIHYLQECVELVSEHDEEFHEMFPCVEEDEDGEEVNDE